MPETLIHVKPSKARVALWLAMKPNFWPDLWRRIKQNIALSLVPPAMGQGRSVATAWAESQVIDENEAFNCLDLDVTASLRETHPQLVESASRIERQTAETLGGGGGIDLIFKICEALEARIVIETGVAYGWSSLAILASIRERNGQLYSVDMPHPLLSNTSLTGVVVPEGLRDAWTLVREPDYTGLQKILAKVPDIDFIHYDSDKSYLGRAATYRALWARLRDGGILMSDDIADNTAFRDFSAEVGQRPIVIYAEGSGLSGSRYVGLIRKA
jgi:predicted O-methyltransferase YrrM